jgi:hypothetical protein
MTTAIDESVHPSSHYHHWKVIPSSRWLAHDEVREALRRAGVTDTTSGIVDQAIDYLAELQYLTCNMTAEWRHSSPKPPPGQPARPHITRVVTRTYWRRPLTEVPFEADMLRVQQESAKAIKDAQADEDTRLLAAAKRLGIILSATTPTTQQED